MHEKTRQAYINQKLPIDDNWKEDNLKDFEAWAEQKPESLQIQVIDLNRVKDRLGNEWLCYGQQRYCQDFNGNPHDYYDHAVGCYETPVAEQRYDQYHKVISSRVKKFEWHYEIPFTAENVYKIIQSSTVPGSQATIQLCVGYASDIARRKTKGDPYTVKEPLTVDDFINRDFEELIRLCKENRSEVELAAQRAVVLSQQNSSTAQQAKVIKKQ